MKKRLTALLLAVAGLAMTLAMASAADDNNLTDQLEKISRELGGSVPIPQPLPKAPPAGPRQSPKESASWPKVVTTAENCIPPEAREVKECRLDLGRISEELQGLEGRYDQFKGVLDGLYALINEDLSKNDLDYCGNGRPEQMDQERKKLEDFKVGEMTHNLHYIRTCLDQQLYRTPRNGGIDVHRHLRPEMKELAERAGRALTLSCAAQIKIIPVVSNYVDGLLKDCGTPQEGTAPR